MKIPVSLLSMYLYCPRKVFLQEVLRLKEPFKPSLLLGGIRHKAFEELNTIEEALVKKIEPMLCFEEVNEIYQREFDVLLKKAISDKQEQLLSLDIDPLDAYLHALPSVRLQAEERAKNVFYFYSRYKIFSDELWEKLTPKIVAEKKVDSDKLQLRGVIDQIHYYGDRVIPVELKTGKAPQKGVWPGHRIQAMCYALLVEEESGLRVNEVEVRYLDHQIKRSIVINPFMRHEVRELIRKVVTLISQDGIPDYCNNKNKCVHCGLKKQCYDEKAIFEQSR